MVNWLKFLESGYENNFVSPHSVEVCTQILHDHSRKGYFEYNTDDFLGRHRKPYFFFVDVNQVAPDIYDFRVERDFRWGKSKSYALTIDGHLDRLPNGTHVIYRVNPMKQAIIALLIGGWLFFMWLGGFTQGLKTPITAPLEVLLFGIQPIIWMSIFWWVHMRPIRQFLEAPQRWLNGEQRTMTDEMFYAMRQPLKSRFDFYTPDSISLCIKKLKQGSLAKHYQDSRLGMMAGTGINGDIFITFKEKTPDYYYFFAERDMWLSHHSPYDSTACVIGILEIEEDMTHVHGYSYLPDGWAYIGGYGIISLVALGIALWQYMPAMLIVMGVGLVGYTMMMTRMNRFHAYPAMTILGIKPNKHQSRLLRGAYKFDFHSPYPLIECVNMLLDYTPTQEYRTQWGIGKHVTLENGFLVTINQSDGGDYTFSIQPKSAPTLMKTEVIGTLQPEGYGTRVNGYVQKRVVWQAIAIMLGIGLIYSLVTTMYALIIILFGILLYIGITENVHNIGGYPYHILSGKNNRKAKDDDRNIPKNG